MNVVLVAKHSRNQHGVTFCQTGQDLIFILSIFHELKAGHLTVTGQIDGLKADGIVFGREPSAVDDPRHLYRNDVERRGQLNAG